VTLDLIRAGGRGGRRFCADARNAPTLPVGNRAISARVLRHEDEDPTLAALRARRRGLGIWLLIGSLG
jgi:hypothetical protein